MKKCILLLLLLSFPSIVSFLGWQDCNGSIFAQTRRNAAYDQYIERYRDLAVEQMRLHGIPASITLAQAILESGAGRSDLASRSNNHFGIKRGNDWQGPTVTHDDDRQGERFRKYNSVRDSYEDHSRFLMRDRYQRLFRLSILDYKGWARGLKACGYATSPTYADRLIELIELYKLYDLDEDPNHPRIPEPPKVEEVNLFYHARLTNNGLVCIRAKRGDTWQSLADELHLSKKMLLKYNEAIETVQLGEGDYVYLQRKAKKGPQHMKGQWHTIQDNESMYSISQLYGIRLASLYKLNYKTADYEAVPGDLLRVR